MLPRASRLTGSGDFRSVIRRGVRVGRPTLVLHVGASAGREDVRVGVVVSKAVGNAVTRNRVKRRLRHLAAAELPRTPAGVAVVIRALAPSAQAGPELRQEFAAAWGKAMRRVGGAP